MNKLELEQNKYINTLYSIVDKLEQRIATLEKVLASHAKCIGELRVKDNQFEINADGTETTKDSIL
jgi:exonuclease VII small subunit